MYNTFLSAETFAYSCRVNYIRVVLIMSYTNNLQSLFFFSIASRLIEENSFSVGFCGELTLL